MSIDSVKKTRANFPTQSYLFSGGCMWLKTGTGMKLKNGKTVSLFFEQHSHTWLLQFDQLSFKKIAF
jgi:hypothetical protein